MVDVAAGIVVAAAISVAMGEVEMWKKRILCGGKQWQGGACHFCLNYCLRITTLCNIILH